MHSHLSPRALALGAGLALTLIGAAVGCKSAPAPTPTPTNGQAPTPPGVPIASAPPALLGAVTQADAAFGLLKSTLGGRLKAAIAAGGPVSAIGVCQDEADSLARKVAKESHVSVGRTSKRLRNPGNTAPWWAEDFVATGAETDGLVFDLGSSIGVLRPIRLDPVCATCHGTALEPTLAAELTRRYPADKATGFTAGELRGYFWADIPKS